MRKTICFLLAYCLVGSAVTISSLALAKEINKEPIKKEERKRQMQVVEVKKEEKPTTLKKVNPVSTNSITVQKICAITEKEEKEVLPIVQKAFKHSKNPKLVLSIAIRETNLNPNLIGKKKELGLTQVNPKVWGKTLKENGIIKCRNDLKRPEISFKATDFILTILMEENKGNLRKALREYNGGDSGKNSRFAKNYADFVLKTRYKI